MSLDDRCTTTVLLSGIDLPSADPAHRLLFPLPLHRMKLILDAVSGAMIWFKDTKNRIPESYPEEAESTTLTTWLRLRIWTHIVACGEFLTIAV